MALEGLNRQAGMHAAGVVIADKPLWEYVPVYQPPGEKYLVTQFAKDEVEEAGLVKFDFLGLKTLTVIQTAINLVNRQAAGRRAARARDDPPRRHADLRADQRGRHRRRVPDGVAGFTEMVKKLKPTASRTSSPPARSTGRARSSRSSRTDAPWSTTTSTASTAARRSSTRTRRSSRCSRTPTASSSTRSR